MNVRMILLHAGQDDLSIEQLRKNLEMDPNFASTHAYLGSALLRKGAFAAAIAELQRATTLSPGRTLYKAGLGYAYGPAGRAPKPASCSPNWRSSQAEGMSPGSTSQSSMPHWGKRIKPSPLCNRAMWTGSRRSRTFNAPL